MSEDTETGLISAVQKVQLLKQELAAAREDLSAARSLLIERDAMRVATMGERDEAREREAKLRKALREAEALLTQGSGSPECHYALGIIRAVLADGEEEEA